ncbi:hypothetical protein WN944_023875 [Citrus x changshan-huyou]|uniref:Uncharacterized protein n=1 Tax=Citrus x changshan-huyou TaxID=2935761 RepID=A0AAP0QC17_9ROSI
MLSGVFVWGTGAKENGLPDRLNKNKDPQQEKAQYQDQGTAQRRSVKKRDRLKQSIRIESRRMLPEQTEHLLVLELLVFHGKHLHLKSREGGEASLVEHLPSVKEADPFAEEGHILRSTELYPLGGPCFKKDHVARFGAKNFVDNDHARADRALGENGHHRKERPQDRGWREAGSYDAALRSASPPTAHGKEFLYSLALKACCYSFPEQTFSEPTARSILVRLESPRTTRAKSCELRSSSSIWSVSGRPILLSHRDRDRARNSPANEEEGTGATTGRKPNGMISDHAWGASDCLSAFEVSIEISLSVPGFHKALPFVAALGDIRYTPVIH